MSADFPSDAGALDRMLGSGRSHAFWTDRPVADDLLRKVYDLAVLGPTSTNCCPARFQFLRGAAKDRLIPFMWEGNVAKVQGAPVTVLIAYDREFWRMLPELFIHRPEVAETYAKNEPHADYTAFHNSTLQVAYFIMAARAHGLDCGPMSGFHRDKLDAEFFPDGRYRTNVLVNLGYADHDKLFPRLPRPAFAEACQIIA